ncbi:MAG: hypothetical protein BWY85_02113 [Firmicutes bacterium ADurb.Bin506]|jgi:hypothetical protein|nr:MAG: hypothetical protein BWY85_02113 [Firmicutes bacterium ADurb.Bin506]
MRKYAIATVIAALLVAALASAVSATHVSAGYMSNNGTMVLTLGGRYDLNGGPAVEGSYSMMPGGFDVIARYKHPIYKSSFVAGPVAEGKITGNHVSADPAIGAGLYAERLGVGGLGLQGSLIFRQRLDSHVGGLVAGVGAKMALSDPLFLAVDASMGITGGVAGTSVSFGVGYQF